MESFGTPMNLCTVPHQISQAAGMPYALYLSLQGKYFLGSTKELLFGNGESAWAGLFNPINSHVNLFVYFWQAVNTGPSPIRVQVWFNSNPPGKPARTAAVTPGNTALCPPPKTKIQMLEAAPVAGEPENGIKAFVRRAQSGTAAGDVESGKFIFPPGGSFVLFLSNPESPAQLAKASVSLAWWEEKI